MLRLATTTTTTTSKFAAASLSAAAASRGWSAAQPPAMGAVSPKHRPYGHATPAQTRRSMTTMTTSKPASLLQSSVVRTQFQKQTVSPLIRHASSRTSHSLSTTSSLLRRPSPATTTTSLLPTRQLMRLLSDDSAKPQPPAATPSATKTKAASAYTPRENIYTVPNFLTAARIAATPFIGYCIVNDQPGMALGLLVTAAFTDLLDGWIARRWNLHTVVGSIIDPMADKILMTVLTVSLAAQGSLPVWLAVLVLGRDVGLAISAIYYRWISLPPPKTFARYWDFSLPSAEVRPTTISKYNTFLQLALMAATTAAPVLETTTLLPGIATGLDLQPYLTTLQYVVGVTTVWSGASYIYSKDAVKILTKKS